MRRHPFSAIGALGLMAAMDMPALAMAQSTERAIVELHDAARPSRKKVNRKRMIAGGYKPKRSRGAQAARKGKTNRNHISKRVRRKHRRSAR